MELFSEPSGLKSFVEEKEKRKGKSSSADSKKAEQKNPDPAECLALAQFEKVSREQTSCPLKRVLLEVVKTMTNDLSLFTVLNVFISSNFYFVDSVKKLQVIL